MIEFNASPSAEGGANPDDAGIPPVEGNLPATNHDALNCRPVRVTVVVPFLNAKRYLMLTAPQVIAAARQLDGTEIIYVDNGSSDGSAEFLRTLEPQIRVEMGHGATISSLRNWGATLNSGDYLSFLDADCGVSPTYFRDAVDEIRTSSADATGCEYSLPETPHWIEKTLDRLHYMGRDRDVIYINAGNFFIRRAAFDAVAGFNERLLTGEDADIGHRLTLAGFRLRESVRVRAIHYGNPKTLLEHYRRTVWHGLGMHGTFASLRPDRPTVMLALHVGATLWAVGLLLSTWSTTAKFLALALSQLCVPALTVAYRVAQTRRAPNIPQALVLYWIYYWARAHSAVLLLLGAAHTYRK